MKLDSRSKTTSAAKILIAMLIIIPCFVPLSDVIWVILSVEIGGLLGVTQQLSSFETEFSSQPCRKIEGNFNPFASPQKNRQSEDNSVKDPGGQSTNVISKNAWGPTEDQNEQEQNGLSQNSVNISPNSHSSNLSVVTYSQVNTE